MCCVLCSNSMFAPSFAVPPADLEPRSLPGITMQAAMQARPFTAQQTPLRRTFASGCSGPRLQWTFGAQRSSCLARAQQQQQEQQQQQPPLKLLNISACAAALLPLSIAASLPAWAEGDDTADQAAAALYQQTTGGSDLVVSILASVVFGLLAVVTGGVAYLSLKNWLDNRQEKEDQKSFTAKPVATVVTNSDDDTIEVKRVRVKREKRGFGDKL